MAHKKAGGSTRNGRDSESKRLGVKVFGGQQISAGGIILCQRGTATDNGVKTDGVVKFEVKGPKNRKYVSVVPA